MTNQELRAMKDEELQAELQELIREHFNLCMQKGTGESAKPHLFKRVKRNIARVKTIVREKSVGAT